MNSPLLGAVTVEALVQLGVRHAVLAPGSRNAPLSLALFEADRAGALQLHVRVDERVAGFTALGLAKATGEATAVVTTSGTATANLAPAAMEAKAAGVPLLVITADRPAEAVGAGANQTGDQLGILGPSALGVTRLSSASGAPHSWSAALARSYALAAGLRTRRPGPVQINLEFEAPLVAPVPQASVRLPVIAAAGASPELLELPPGPRTVVLAGDAPPAVGAEARACAELAQAPLLAEPSSNARAGDCAIAAYRNLLDGDLGAQIQRVVVFGHPTLSRPVARLLSREDLEIIVVSSQASWFDIGSRARAVVDRVVLGASERDWLDSWLAADRAHDVAQDWGGPELAAAVVASCASDDVLMLGSSKIIRDADLTRVSSHPPRVYANRGLSGIDGTIATATGIALALRRRITVLLGDLSFQHDLGALVSPEQEPRAQVRIVVADDNGGAIFHGLEQGAPEFADAFERVFGTPQGLDLVRVAQAMGWEAERVASRAELDTALDKPGSRVIVASLNRGGVSAPAAD